MTAALLLLLAQVAAAGPAPGADAAAGDTLFDAAARRGIGHVYNLEFERAEEDFRELARLRPGQPEGPFFLAMVDWWRIMIDLDNRQYDDRFLAALDRVVEICDSLLEGNDRDVNAIFFKGGAIGFQGRLRFHRNDYFAAANAGRKALPLVQDATSLDPGNSDILLGSGIYNYYADVIPQEYPFVRPLLLFIPPGDRKKGIAQLTQASRSAKYAAVEATYFLLQIYYFYERDYAQALRHSLDLNARFPSNPLFHRYVGRSHVSLGNWESAAGVWREVAQRCRGGVRGYGPGAEREASYYLGMHAMVTRNPAEALVHFYRCDEISRGLDRAEQSGFMVMANLKIGQIYDLQGKRDLALAQYAKVVSWKAFGDSRQQAEQFQKSPYRE